jgi:hypothetical protein
MSSGTELLDTRPKEHKSDTTNSASAKPANDQPVIRRTASGKLINGKHAPEKAGPKDPAPQKLPGKEPQEIKLPDTGTSDTKPPGIKPPHTKLKRDKPNVTDSSTRKLPAYVPVAYASSLEIQSLY